MSRIKIIYVAAWLVDVSLDVMFNAKPTTLKHQNSRTPFNHHPLLCVIPINNFSPPTPSPGKQ